MSRMVIYGVRPVTELLRHRGRPVRQLLVGRRQKVGELVRLAEARNVHVRSASMDELDRLSQGASHQGVVALVGEFRYQDLEDLLERPGQTPLLVALDCVQDPQNLGAIFRSSLVLGATGLVLPRDRAAGVTPVVVRVSAGATEHLPCAQVTNLARSLTQAREAGLWVVGTVERGGAAPHEVDLTGPTVLVLGNEQRGLRPLVQRNCDALITVPAAAALAALNVAATAAVVCYEAARQRGHQPTPAADQAQ